MPQFIFFLEKVYLTPLTIGGCLLHPLIYKTSYSTPQTIENYLNNHLRRFWRLFCWRGILKSLHNIQGWLHNPFNYRTWYWPLKVSNNNVQMTPDGFVGPFGHRIWPHWPKYPCLHAVPFIASKPYSLIVLNSVGSTCTSTATATK